KRHLHALSLATLAIVVLALAILQYRWIDQVSEAEETRVTSRVREELRLVADAIDIEITRAALVFTVPPIDDAAIEDSLAQTWRAWNDDAPWPKIVSGFSYLERDGGRWRTRSWGAPGTLDPRSIPGHEQLEEPPRPGRL